MAGVNVPGPDVPLGEGVTTFVGEGTSVTSAVGHGLAVWGAVAVGLGSRLAGDAGAVALGEDAVLVPVAVVPPPQAAKAAVATNVASTATL
jgi:hypothetical protein